MSNAAPAGRTRPWWRWPLLGCVIALGVAGGIIIASVSCLAVVGYLVKEAVEEEEIASSLSLGQAATIDGLQVVIDRFEMSEGPRPGPAPGAQFLWVHIAVQNVGDTPVNQAVLLKMEYKGAEVGESWVHDEAHPGFPARVRLFPGTGSEGWAVFEVPLGVELSGVTVVFKEVLRLPPKVASWRLAGPEEAGGR